MSVAQFCEVQQSLLTLEHDAELAESSLLLETATPSELETKGVAIVGLVVSNVTTGLFGKTVVSFSHHLANSRKHAETARLGANSVSSGAIVGIFSTGSFTIDPVLTGVVHAIDFKCVKIVLDKDDDAPKLWEFPRFNVAKIGNNVTHTRLIHTLKDLEHSTHSLVHSLFESDAGDCSGREGGSPYLFTPSGKSLNTPQQDAVRKALSNPLLTVIQGPPGTGKTTTLAAYIAEAVHRNPQVKILACAPSNVAVDNLALRVLATGVKNIVRVGHPTRVDEDMLSHCLDALVAGSDFASSCSDIRKEIQQILDARRGYSDLKPLRKELKEREQKSVAQVFKQSNVVFTTCNGAFNISRKFDSSFDICVVDECAQALEITCWIPILQAQSAVLGGDHKQLSATIHSKEAERGGLGTSLFERCFTRFAGKDHIVNLLSVQYRMHDIIMGWSNQQFYNNLLVAHESVADQTLHTQGDVSLHIGGVDMRSVMGSPFVFCDTAGVDGAAEDSVDERASKSNAGEVVVVTKYLDLIGVPGLADDVCVISPYMRQTELIRQAVGKKQSQVDISTVDSFQGREGDVVIISLVRSNPGKVVGFLSDYRRLNVAVTRAKRHVFIVGDSETISSDPVLKSLFDYACDRGLVISAHSFLEGVDQLPPSSARPVVHKPTEQVKVRKATPPAQLPRDPFKAPVVAKCSTDDSEDRRTEFARRIDSIKAGEKFVFPSTLLSSDRRLIHSICEERGIDHGSSGDRDDRYVWVMKQASKKITELISIPVRSHVPASPASVITPKVPQVITSKAPVVKPRTTPVVKKPDPNEAKPPGICPHAQCPMSTKLIALPCGLCKREFCIAHATPEVHGCGDAAKKAARAQMKKDFKQPLFPLGKGGVSTEQLRNKMEWKLASLQEKRSTGKKKD